LRLEYTEIVDRVTLDGLDEYPSVLAYINEEAVTSYCDEQWLTHGRFVDKHLHHREILFLGTWLQ
jgi:hypothetical protein